jgi:hypothetical protein
MWIAATDLPYRCSEILSSSFLVIKVTELSAQSHVAANLSNRNGNLVIQRDEEKLHIEISITRAVDYNTVCKNTTPISHLLCKIKVFH